MMLSLFRIAGHLKATELNEKVRIGLNYAITGPYSIHGQYQYRAIMMAQEEINVTGGILRHAMN